MDSSQPDDRDALLRENERLRARVAALEPQHALIEGVLANVPDVIARFDRSLRHVYVSPAITQVTGLPPSAFIGKTNRNLAMPPHLIAQWDMMLEQVFSTGAPARLTFAFRGVADEHHYEAYCVPEYTADGTVESVVTVARDITARVQLEQQLRESQTLLSSILDHAPAAILVKDRAGRFQLVSHKMVTGLGFTRMEELIGKTDADFFPPEVCAILRADEEQILATATSLQREYSLLIGDTVSYVLSVGFPIYDHAGEISATGYISTDITERKRAEAALREREAMLRAIGDNLPKGMIYQFVYNPDRTWYYTYVSAGIERISGVTEAQLLKNPQLLRDMIVPEDRERIHAAEVESFEQLTTFDVEVQKRLPSGELRWSHLCSQPRRMDGGRVVWDGIETDITEHKQTEAALVRLATDLEARVAGRTAQLTETIQRLEQAAAERMRSEAALRESQRFVAQIAAVSPIILSVYDLRTHQIVYANPELTTLLGYTAADYSELSKDTMSNWLHPNERAAADHIRAGFLSLADGEVFEYEYRVRDASGGWRWFATRGSVFERTPVGQVARVLVAALDITARRQAEEELRQYHRRLVAVQETERAHLARELHDEVGQILTGLNLVLEAGMHGDRMIAQRQIREAQALVNDLTARVRQLSVDLRPAVLDDLGLLPALNWLVKRYMAQTNVNVQIQHQGMDAPIAPAIAITVYRVVQEALTNVARHAGTPQATLQLWTTETLLYVQITDEGRGFDAAAVLAAATSTGLAGMHERAQLLGGKTTIDTAPGVGTRILIELPLR